MGAQVGGGHVRSEAEAGAGAGAAAPWSAVAAVEEERYANATAGAPRAGSSSCLRRVSSPVLSMDAQGRGGNVRGGKQLGKRFHGSANSAV